METNTNEKYEKYFYPTFGRGNADIRQQIVRSPVWPLIAALHEASEGVLSVFTARTKSGGSMYYGEYDEIMMRVSADGDGGVTITYGSQLGSVKKIYSLTINDRTAHSGMYNMHIQNTSVRALVSRIVDSTPPKREVKKFGHRLRSLCSGHCSARLDKKLLPSLILNSVYVLAENNYYEAVARTPYIVASGVQSLSKKAKEDLLKIACGGMWLSDSEDAALIKNLYNMYTEHVAVKTKALDEFRVFMSDTHKWLVVYYAGLGYLVTKLSITVEEFLRGNDNPKIEHIRPYMFYSSIEDMPEHMRTDLMDSLTFAKINASRNPQINWDSSWQKDVAPELPLAHPYTYASSGAAEYHGCTRNIILREVGAVLGHYQQRESGAVYALVDASEHPE